MFPRTHNTMPLNPSNTIRRPICIYRPIGAASPKLNHLSTALANRLSIAMPSHDHDDRVLSILETLPSWSNRPCAFVPDSFADRLRADRDAASICFLVCWCIVLEYAERENCPSISYSCVDS
jgi:hypothetical protein